MRDERISYTKPISFDPYSKCLAVVAFVSVRKIAKHLQRHLHGVVPFGVQLFPYSQCSVVYSAVYRMVGTRADGCLQVLCHTHNDRVDVLNLRSLHIDFLTKFYAVHFFEQFLNLLS